MLHNLALTEASEDCGTVSPLASRAKLNGDGFQHPDAQPWHLQTAPPHRYDVRLQHALRGLKQQAHIASQPAASASSACGLRARWMVLKDSPKKPNFFENSDATRVSAVAKKICRPELTARSRR